jgi:hypothetical protein
LPKKGKEAENFYEATRWNLQANPKFLKKKNKDTKFANQNEKFSLKKYV